MPDIDDGDGVDGEDAAAGGGRADAEGPGGRPLADGTACADVGDRELLAAHVAGDARAFGALVARHERQLWWTAKRHSRNEADAADALQDALLNAIRSAPSFRMDSSVATWLHRIVVNCCLDRLRGRHGPPDGVTDARALAAVSVPRVGDVSLAVVVGEALDRLSDAQRDVIIEVDVRGWPVAEAARRLGIAEGTVKSRRARARDVLRRYLERHLDGWSAPSRTERPR